MTDIENRKLFKCIFVICDDFLSEVVKHLYEKYPHRENFCEFVNKKVKNHVTTGSNVRKLESLPTQGEDINTFYDFLMLLSDGYSDLSDYLYGEKNALLKIKDLRNSIAHNKEISDKISLLKDNFSDFAKFINELTGESEFLKLADDISHKIEDIWHSNLYKSEDYEYNLELIIDIIKNYKCKTETSILPLHEYYYPPYFNLRESIITEEKILSDNNWYIIFGKSGIGKTSFCWYIFNKWEKKELTNFKLAFLIECDKFRSVQKIDDYFKEIGLEDIIFTKTIKKQCQLLFIIDNFTPESTKFIQDILRTFKNPKIIIATDEDHKEDLILVLKGEEKFNFQEVLIRGFSLKEHEELVPKISKPNDDIIEYVRLSSIKLRDILSLPVLYIVFLLFYIKDGIQINYAAKLYELIYNYKLKNSAKIYDDAWQVLKKNENTITFQAWNLYTEFISAEKGNCDEYLDNLDKLSPEPRSTKYFSFWSNVVRELSERKEILDKILKRKLMKLHSDWKLNDENVINALNLLPFCAQSIPNINVIMKISKLFILEDLKVALALVKTKMKYNRTKVSLDLIFSDDLITNDNPLNDIIHSTSGWGEIHSFKGYIGNMECSSLGEILHLTTLANSAVVVKEICKLKKLNDICFIIDNPEKFFEEPCQIEQTVFHISLDIRNLVGENIKTAHSIILAFGCENNIHEVTLQGRICPRIFQKVFCKAEDTLAKVNSIVVYSNEEIEKKLYNKLRNHFKMCSLKWC